MKWENTRTKRKIQEKNTSKGNNPTARHLEPRDADPAPLLSPHFPTHMNSQGQQRMTKEKTPQRGLTLVTDPTRSDRWASGTRPTAPPSVSGGMGGWVSGRIPFKRNNWKERQLRRGLGGGRLSWGWGVGEGCRWSWQGGSGRGGLFASRVFCCCSASCFIC